MTLIGTPKRTPPIQAASRMNLGVPSLDVDA